MLAIQKICVLQHYISRVRNVYLKNVATCFGRLFQPTTQERNTLGDTRHPERLENVNSRYIVYLVLYFLFDSINAAVWSIQSKVCGRLLAGIAGSNTAGSMDVCVL